MIRTACILTSVMLLAAPAAAQPRYSFTVIGAAPPSAPSGPLSQPLALNNSGRVVGYSYTSTGNIQALNWKAGAIYTLGGLASFSSTFANRVNINGRIAGTGYLMGPGGQIIQSRALKWTGGVMSDLGGLGGSHAAALAINDNEQLVGFATLAGDMQVRAFIYQNGAMSQINTFPGATESYAYDISNSGFVAGACIAGSPAKPFLWRSGAVTQLPIPVGSRTGAANAVNEVGTAVGTWEVNQYTGSFAACVWTAGQRFDLPYLGGSLAYAVASDINNFGQIVGTSNSAAGYTGFVYMNQQMYDLRNLVTPPLVITAASAINDRGQIAASALIAGRQTAVLLTPLAVTTVQAPIGSPIGITLPR